MPEQERPSPPRGGDKRHHRGANDQRRGEEEPRARQVPRGLAADEECKHLREQARAEEIADAHQARVCALQRALLARADAAAHETERRGVGQSP